jgi:hypothetical protein
MEQVDELNFEIARAQSRVDAYEFQQKRQN